MLKIVWLRLSTLKSLSITVGSFAGETYTRNLDNVHHCHALGDLCSASICKLVALGNLSVLEATSMPVNENEHVRLGYM